MGHFCIDFHFFTRVCSLCTAVSQYKTIRQTPNQKGVKQSIADPEEGRPGALLPSPPTPTPQPLRRRLQKLEVGKTRRPNANRGKRTAEGAWQSRGHASLPPATPPQRPLGSERSNTLSLCIPKDMIILLYHVAT